MAKLRKFCLREAKKDIAFAKKKLNDKKWQNMASEVSKKMVFDNANTTPQKLAKEHCDYLKYRACAKGRAWGSEVFIDPSARKKYKKITGRLPICK